MKYGIVTKSVARLYETYDCKEERELSLETDEVFCGMGLLFLGQQAGDYEKVSTCYGYQGWMKRKDAKAVSLKELMEWERGPLLMVRALTGDVLTIPKVQGKRLAVLFRGSLVRDLGQESGSYRQVALPDGRLGFIHKASVGPKLYSQAGLWQKMLPQRGIRDEEGFRRAVIEDAKAYMGVQYRWAGKSAAGIDCSGLTSLSYLCQGILIYRDAKMIPGFPVRKIAWEHKKPGDLLYFPGHIAMYLGRDEYIHSTGSGGGVRINSLTPGDCRYRKDLAESVLAVGSIF